MKYRYKRRWRNFREYERCAADVRLYRQTLSAPGIGRGGRWKLHCGKSTGPRTEAAKDDCPRLRSNACGAIGKSNGPKAQAGNVSLSGIKSLIYASRSATPCPESSSEASTRRALCAMRAKMQMRLSPDQWNEERRPVVAPPATSTHLQPYG